MNKTSAIMITILGLTLEFLNFNNNTFGNPLVWPSLEYNIDKKILQFYYTLNISFHPQMTMMNPDILIRA